MNGDGLGVISSSRWQLGELGGGLFDLAQRQPVCSHGQMQGAVKAERPEFFLRHISFCDHKTLVDSVFLLFHARNSSSGSGTVLENSILFQDTG